MNISTVSHLSRDTKHAAQEGADLESRSSREITPI